MFSIQSVQREKKTALATFNELTLLYLSSVTTDSKWNNNRKLQNLFLRKICKLALQFIYVLATLWTKPNVNIGFDASHTMTVRFPGSIVNFVNIYRGIPRPVVATDKMSGTLVMRAVISTTLW
jgi:hypothetical protein